MISDRAKDSFDRIFRRAAQARLPLGSADGCDITPATNRHGGADAMSGSKAVMGPKNVTLSGVAPTLVLTSSGW